MSNSCFTPCLLTGFGVMLIFIIAHIFLYLKLLELSKERHHLSSGSHETSKESDTISKQSNVIPKKISVTPKNRRTIFKKRQKKT
jgi:hypothetical protein